LEGFFGQTSGMAREPETYCGDAIFKTGIGQMVVCRYKSVGRVETGCFLVDVRG